ncbi:MAG: hypothetical protein LBD31_10740 [Treponema sp.]|jgi:hypothetical protein|nr:hypothetical protein [Treponema sp.]
MIDYAVREALGPYGRAMLDFWLEHTIVISSIVLLYGILVICAQRNLQNMVHKCIDLLGKETLMRAEPEKIWDSQNQEFWNTVQQSSHFPFIALPFSLVVHRITSANMNKLLGRYFSYQQKAQQARQKRLKQKASL